MLTLANISELCRICLRHLRQQQQQHAATGGSPSTLQRNRSSYNSRALPHLAKMLNQFFGIDVLQQSDNLPQNICTLCYNAVEYFEQLCNVATQTNETLKRLTLAQEEDEQKKTTTPVSLVDTHLLPHVKDEPIDDDAALEQPQDATDEDAASATDADATADAEGEADAETEGRDEEATASKRKLLACQQCGKQVYKLPYLEAHIRSVHEGHPKPFLCANCDKAFTRYEQLRSHMRNVHPTAVAATNEANDELELICEQCNRKYSTKNALGEHLKRHAQEKPHICEHCGVAKVTRTELLTHLRIHNPDWEKFKCKQCPQLFRHKSAISRHVRVVHEGQRRFQCGHCQKRFGTHASQVRHERLHIASF
ncbi:zinc finger protein 599 [Drosophila albomicans]|uniref:Zinc finger protein 599 n=1 Tax=Drosophila albomicans TaxID=7291 RepID=A0A6P8YAZ8_DROAB|nr:zinc finger protein 599 [Drosophila albomicans]